MSKMHLLLLGAGYTAGFVAKAFAESASTIYGTTRSRARFERLQSANIEPVLFDAEQPLTADSALISAWRRATHVVVSVAPNRASSIADPVLDKLAPLLRESVIEKQLPPWICYLSTVGVYGDSQGAWLDESSPCIPGAARSQQRLRAEQEWQAFAEEVGAALAVFRLPGIYGPGRNALMNVQSGKARRLIKPGQVFNRVHVEDIAWAVKCAALAKVSGLYNICDDHPSPPQDVVSYATHLMGVEPLPDIQFAEAELSAMAKSFYSENKRVSNARSKTLPNMRYQYPDFKTGLSALWESGHWNRC